MRACVCGCGVIAHLSCSSPWWLQSWPCWAAGWAPLRRAGGWLAASGSYSSGCSSVPRLSSRCLSFSPGPATSSSPPAVPSLRCPNTESCRTEDKTKVGCGVAKLLKCRWERRARMCVFFVCVCSWSFALRLVVPSSRQGRGHRGRLWGGASDLLPIRTSRWGCWRGKDACVDSHCVVRVHCNVWAMWII